MDIVVQKFGGTSVGDMAKIRHVAEIVASEYAHNPVVVVVSAMAGETNRLVNYTGSFTILRSNTAALQEYDAIVAAGEQVAVGLLCLALMQIGLKARSYLGWQLPLLTNSEYSRGRIVDVNVEPLVKSLENGVIPIVAGFQGVYNERIITLGRGGSDTTATAIAAKIDAKRCDIYTDVDGVFTADPKIVTKAQQLREVSYEDMLEMSALGAKVLHPRAAVMAMKYHLNVRILSTFNNKCGGTILRAQKMEEEFVTAITSSSGIASITLCNLNQQPEVVALVIDSLASYNIAVDMIIHHPITNNFVFTVSKEYVVSAENALKKLKNKYYGEIIVDGDIAKVSIIGIGMKSNLHVVQKVFRILNEHHISTMMFNAFETRISLFVKTEHSESAVCALHSGFNLGL
ncbi:Aspartokinase [Alphaproteobacteria bacterium]